MAIWKSGSVRVWYSAFMIIFMARFCSFVIEFMVVLNADPTIPHNKIYKGH